MGHTHRDAKHTKQTRKSGVCVCCLPQKESLPGCGEVGLQVRPSRRSAASCADRVGERKEQREWKSDV